MKYIEIPDGSPAFHLACEEVIFDTEKKGDILLLWRNSPVIVCGAHQNIYQETSVYRAQKQGIEILRRVSGGGTVYHDDGNLNYSVIMDEEKFKTYDDLLSGILSAMNAAGIPAEKGRICDINVGGVKVSGNAQRIAHGRILQHGTLLYDADLSVLRSVSGRQGRHYVSRATLSNPAEVGNIKPFWNGGSVEDFQEALLLHYPGDVEHTAMTEEQLAEARRLETEKYGDWKWNFGKSPKFTCDAKSCVNRKPCSVTYGAKKGIIQEIDLQGDGVSGNAGKVFEGCRLDVDEIIERAKEVTDAPEELADLIL
ncbi:MAG: biotin/lipoate A/B protein ligase family protein [Eubacterium sp.]